MDPQLKAKVTEFISKISVPGIAICIDSVRGRELITTGYADVDTGAKFDTKLLYRIGSVTKTFTAYVLLQLCSEQKISLDDTVAKYLCHIPNSDKITIRDIGLMRSGIASYTEDKQMINIVTKTDPHKQWKPSELLAVGVSKPLDFEPGTQFCYSNTNTIIMGLIIEKITGNSLDHEINNRIIGPLNLTSTYFDTGYIDHVSDQHNQHDHNHSHHRQFVQGYEQPDNHLKNVTTHNLSWAWAAGSIASNIDDMAKYSRAVGAGTLLGSGTDIETEHLNFVSSSSANFNLTRSYGFHLMKIGEFVGHNGSVPGYNSVILHNNKLDLTIVVVANTQRVVYESKEVGPADIVAEYIVSQVADWDC